MKKVLLSEVIDEAGMRVLEGRVQVVVSPDPSNDTVGRLITDAEALILRTATQVTRAMIQKAPFLKVISRTGGGLNNVDVEAATEHKVVVCGVKGPQDRFVAEHTISLMGALAKQFFYLDGQTRKGNFKSRFEYKPAGLAEKRVGLIGLGRIGRIVAEMCTHGFEMEVWGYDPYVDPKGMGALSIRVCETMEEVIRTADFLSLHVPATDQTRGLIGKRELEMMKPGSFVINTSRGEVIQESALVDALKQGSIAGAGLDVFEKEPPGAGHPLFQIPNVILTPHSAALTKESVAQLAEGAAENALRVLEGKAPSFSPNWDAVGARIQEAP